EALLFGRALNLRLLRLLWLRLLRFLWLCLRRAAWFRRKSAAAFQMVVGCRILHGWSPRRRVCPPRDKVFDPAAARASGKQRSENRYDKNAPHDGRFPEDAALAPLRRERPHEIEQSQVTKARCIALSPIHVAKDEPRQFSSRRVMMFQIRRE